MAKSYKGKKSALQSGNALIGNLTEKYSVDLLQKFAKDSNGDILKQTPGNGFTRMDSYDELEQNLENLLSEKHEFFSSMKPRRELGRIIEIANREPEFEAKVDKFLSLIRK